MAATNVQTFPGDVEVASNLAVDTNTLLVDSVSNRIGIGTTIPQNTLAAVGNVTFGAGASTTSATHHSGMLNVIGGGTRALLRIENDNSVGSPGIIFGEGGTFTEDTVPTIKKVQGTNNLAITTGGNVGIGMDTPAESLEVSGNYRAGRTTGGYMFGVDDGGSVQAGVYSDANNGLIFKAGVDSEKMRILNGGNVGIGTDNPNVLLELSSDTGSAIITPTELRLSTTTNAGDWDIANPWGKISFYSHDTSNSGPQIRGAIGMSASENFGGYGRLGLFMENAGTLSESVSIKHDGKVGIGMDTPAESLEVSGNYRAGRTTGGYTFGVDDGGSVQAGIYSDINNGLDFKTGSGSQAMYLSDGLAVFIPNHIKHTGDENTYMGFDSADLFVVVTNGSHAIKCNSAQNVDIQNYIRHIGDENTYMGFESTDLFVVVTNGSHAIKCHSDQSVDIQNYIRHIGDEDTYFGFNAANSFRVAVGGNARFQITSAGNVGLGGLTSPTAQVHIQTNGDGYKVQQSTTSYYTTVSGGSIFVNNPSLSGGYEHCIMNNAANGGHTTTYFSFRRSNGQIGSILTQNGATINFNTGSDYRLKENIVPMSNVGLEVINKLQPKVFNFKNYPNQMVHGFIAHELQEHIPIAVSGEKDAMTEKGNIVKIDDESDVIRKNVSKPDNLDEGTKWIKVGEEPEYQGVDASKIVPWLVKAIQEISEEIQTLKTRLDALESA